MKSLILRRGLGQSRENLKSRATANGVSSEWMDYSASRASHGRYNDMNAYLRLKRALTEEEPLSNSYREELWAELGDYMETPIETSILLLESLHSRLYILLIRMKPVEFTRTLRTQALGVITIDTALQRFVWHNRHHIAQIQTLIDRMRW